MTFRSEVYGKKMDFEKVIRTIVIHSMFHCNMTAVQSCYTVIRTCFIS